LDQNYADSKSEKDVSFLKIVFEESPGFNPLRWRLALFMACLKEFGFRDMEFFCSLFIEENLILKF